LGVLPQKENLSGGNKCIGIASRNKRDSHQSGMIDGYLF
jgi:hypothetical protein